MVQCGGVVSKGELMADSLWLIARNGGETVLDNKLAFQSMSSETVGINSSSWAISYMPLAIRS
jgi:hypothetical protein